jgi:flagellar protein FliS
MAKRVSIYLEQEILSANNLQLVHILYQATIHELREARRSMAARQIPEKCARMTHACNLIGELLSSLDMTAGGEIAVRLKALYEYMLTRLLQANLKNLEEPVADVIALLSTLDEAWKELANQKPPTPPPSAQAFISGDLDVPSQAWSF